MTYLPLIANGQNFWGPKPVVLINLPPFPLSLGSRITIIGGDASSASLTEFAASREVIDAPKLNHPNPGGIYISFDDAYKVRGDRVADCGDQMPDSFIGY